MNSVIDGFDPGLRAFGGREIVEPFPVKIIGDADFDLVKTVKDIQLGQGNIRDTGGFNRLSDKNRIEPAAPALPARHNAEFMSALAKLLPGFVQQFSGKRPLPHTGGIGFCDPQDRIDRGRAGA